MLKNVTQPTTLEQIVPYSFTALKELGLFLFIVAFVWIVRLGQAFIKVQRSDKTLYLVPDRERNQIDYKFIVY